MKLKPSLLSFLPLKSLNFLRLTVTLSAISHAGITSLHAADIYWDGGEGSWGDVASWSLDPGAATPDPAAVPGSADTAIFNISTVNQLQHITLDADRSVTSLIIKNVGFNTNLRGNSADTTARTLTIGSGGITIESTANFTDIGQTPATYGAVNIELAADQTWTNNSIRAINAVGVVSGDFQITKEGTGVLRLTAANTYTGGTIINAGTVVNGTELNHSFLGSADNAQATVNAGGILALGRSTITGTLTLNGGQVQSGNGFGATWDGSIILQSTSFFMNGGAGGLTVNAEISGPGGLSRTAAANDTRVVLNSANTFTGDTVWGVTNGRFEINHELALQNSTLDTANSGLGGVGNVERGIKISIPTLTLGGLSGDKDLKSLFATNATAGGYNNLTALTLNPGTGKTPVYSAVIGDGATGMTLTKTGEGTQTLSGTNTYTGGTTVTAGTLTIDGSLTDATATISSGTLNGTGTLTFNIDGTSTDLITMTGGTFNIADLTVAINPTGAGLTEPEYLLVDASGGTISGATFEGLTGATGYELDYDISGQIKLVQTGGGTPFATWIGGFGLDPGDQGFDFDADGDGMGNGVEAWFGTNPSIGGSGLTQIAKSGNTVTFTHPEADPALIDVTGSYQWSLDLVSWNASATIEDLTTVTIAAAKNDPTPGTTTVTATITGTEPAKIFVRAVATQP